MPLLRVEGIRVDYGAIPALLDVSLTVDSGEVVALLGPNGAGKTTLLKAIGGLLRTSRGEIHFAEHQLHRLRADQIARRGVSLVPEGRGIFPALSVEDNLQMGGYWAGDDFETRLAMVTEYFPILSRRRRQAAASLSGGEQQQLAIGRALMAEPRLLMLDEMSLGLAPIVVRELFGILERINAGGTAVLLVEQQAPQALAAADRVYVLERGRITISGTSTEVAGDVAALSQAYLGEGRRAIVRDRGADHDEVDIVEQLNYSVPMAHHHRRALQTLADRAGVGVGDYVGRLLSEHVQAALASDPDRDTGAGHKLSTSTDVDTGSDVWDSAAGVAPTPAHSEVGR